MTDETTNPNLALAHFVKERREQLADFDPACVAEQLGVDEDSDEWLLLCAMWDEMKLSVRDAELKLAIERGKQAFPSRPHPDIFPRPRRPGGPWPVPWFSTPHPGPAHAGPYLGPGAVIHDLTGGAA